MHGRFETRRAARDPGYPDDMETAGVIGRYAICGAVAAFQYIEPAVTQHLDISVYLPGMTGPIVTSSPIVDYLARIGRPTEWQGEGLVIGRWPVQFLTANDPLDRAALDSSETFDFDGVPTRFWRLEYLMVKCLQVGRPKDHARLDQFLDEPFDRNRFCDMLRTFDLKAKWLITSDATTGPIFVKLTLDEIFAAERDARKRFRTMTFVEKSGLSRR